jgi:hypothetical protein
MACEYEKEIDAFVNASYNFGFLASFVLSFACKPLCWEKTDSSNH